MEKKSIYLRITQDMKKWYEHQATDMGMSMNGLFVAVLSEYQVQMEAHAAAEDSANRIAKEKERMNPINDF